MRVTRGGGQRLANGRSASKLGQRPAFLAMLASFAFSGFGSGLVYPFTALFISGDLHLGNPAAAAYFATGAGSATLAAIAAGRLGDRLGVRGPGACGPLLMAAAYALLGTATSLPTVMASAVTEGVGIGLYQMSFVPTVAAAAGPMERQRAFSLRYLAANVGLGTGAALGGLIVTAAHGIGTYRLLYMADAVTFLPIAIAMARLGPRRSAHSGGGTSSSGYRSLLANRRICLLLLIQAVAWVFAFGQLETAVPLALHRAMALSPRLVAYVMGANSLGVVVLQLPMLRLLSRVTDAARLAVGMALWATAFGCAVVASVVPDPGRLWLVFCFSVLFAAAATTYAASAQPLLVTLVPEHQLPRASALASIARTGGQLTGPVIGVILIDTCPTPLAWGVFAIALTGGAVVALGLHQWMHGSEVLAVAEQNVRVADG
jgi:MFS family permease